ncbi:hypothetical protein SPAN111604_02910 [Sphingomonas antarctica]
MMFKKLALTAVAVGGLAAATPSYAVVTTFADFSATTQVRNIRWQKVGSKNGMIYSTSTGSANTPGNVNVKFSFLQPYFTNNNIAQSVTAVFLLSGTTTNDAASKTPLPTVPPTNYLTQSIDSLTFSFKSTAPITVGNVTYAAGSNLLSGTVVANSTIGGTDGGFSAGLTNSTAGGNTVTYTSDFLDFSNTVNRSFSISLDALLAAVGSPPVNKGLNAGNGQSLSSFRATATGSFSSDPAPIINAVPEPAVWGMMIAGFGVVGFQSRRRRSIKSVTA